MANLDSESYHSLISFLTAEYLGFLKLKVVPWFAGTRTCISPVPVNRNRGILTSDIREVKIPRVPVYGYEYRHFVYQFLLMLAFLRVISTRFPAVNRCLHVKTNGHGCCLFTICGPFK
jgi:hypothetical protein